MPDWCSLKDTCNPNDTVIVQVSPTLEVKEYRPFSLLAPPSMKSMCLDANWLYFSTIKILVNVLRVSGLVFFQSSYSIYAPHAFTPQAKDLSRYSGSLNIDLYDASDSPIKVTEASEPISMIVPLDRNMPVPGEEYVVPFIPDRDWEYFFYHTTEIKSARAALQIRFRLEDLNQQFLVLVKFGDIKNISKAFDHVCMIPSKMEYQGVQHW